MSEPSARNYPDKPKKVYLYGTCLINSLYPDSGMDALTILESQGIEVIFPQGQSCCGQPAYNSGYQSEAKQVAKAQVGQFPLPIPIVVLSGSCAGMMRHHYPALLGESDSTKDFCERVFEFSEFLAYVLKLDIVDKGPQESIALHTSCAARREMGCEESSLALLGKLSNVSVVEHEKRPECCGFGGTFAVKHPDISAAMVKDKCNHLLESNVNRYVSCDWGCMMNINGALNYQNESLKGEHLASYLCKRMNLNSADGERS